MLILIGNNMIFLFPFLQVLSGDNIVIRGQPKGGPPPERQLALSNVIAPRLARRPISAIEATETNDEVG